VDADPQKILEPPTDGGYLCSDPGAKMADSSFVLCDVLCYLMNKYGKVAMRLLKTAVMDFYTVDVLADAKVRLQNDILAMNLSTKLPHIPKRRGGRRWAVGA